ncbi:LuxR C-terminal-related transcriptional regulator [Tengunoibacter tsumagoiensis]|uniref:LuxR family transcriptional regulator n=1 Tax=Tengunoibacter tsumagoiensis TaxID=2014871 RepID=A0A401ZUX9_9CHLR|nr:LuxR C-terminal-related transcriptional regulator [Tengunoibacter tsumagoiensis]GCE10701.1 LuxR family transcriptional regulator [Tengunoibacter tsumagoiensis]
MAHTTPTIRDAVLHFYENEQEISISVGSARWFAWLQEETTLLFSFHSLDGSYTARKEHAGNHRGGYYWKAYLKRQGRLSRAYLGKSEDLTLDRLNEVAMMLAKRPLSRQPPQMAYPQPAATPLLQSKLHPPRLPVQLVERIPLLELLDKGRRQKLTLVQAPAGFGKTTLVAQWIARSEAQAAIQRKPWLVAWLSLDSGDNDPIRFWSSLIAAIPALYGHIGQVALAQLSQQSQSPFAPAQLEAALASLLNDLTGSVPEGVLVLEDYHLIEHERIHKTLTFFIEHLPADFHIVMLTRSTPPLPLVRWRARGDLQEIHPNQLSFSLEETTVFLQQHIPTPFSEEAARKLHIYLEGWAAGLRLFVLNSQSQRASQMIEEAFGLPHIGLVHNTSRRSIQEFFISEVLAAQPESLQLFLLQTSLFSRLTASLCDAVMGRQDSAEWLERVERSGIFLEALESADGWYRYHALFAEAMRTEAIRRLGAEALRYLAAQASRWYEEHALLSEAIETALSAQEFERASLLIERLNEHAYFTEYHTMCRWLDQIPKSLLPSHPTLCFLFAQARIFSADSPGPIWRIEPAEELLQMAEEGWRAQGELLQIGVLSAFRATFTIVHGFIAPAVAYAHQALQLLPSASAEQVYHQRPVEWIEWHCGCLLTLGMEAMQTGAFHTARQYLREGYTFSLHVKDRVFTRVIGRLLGDVYFEMGELHQANSYYQQTQAEPPWLDQTGEAIFLTQLACGFIRLAYEWNDLEKAEQLAYEASLHHYEGTFPAGEEAGYTQLELLRLLLLRARGKKTEEDNALTALLTHLQAAPHTLLLIPDVLIWQTRAQIRDGDLLAAKRTLNTLTGYEKDLSATQQQAMQLLSARLLMAQGEAAAALPLLKQLFTHAQEEQHLVSALEIQVLIALASADLKQSQESYQQLASALSQARREGFLRLFLDEGEPLAILLRKLIPSLTEKPLRAYAQSILHAHAHSFSFRASNPDSPLLELLSAQELRVLTLLVAGHSNPEIAEELIISINTVKGHIKNIYRKLDVNNRVEAGEVARRLKLL